MPAVGLSVLITQNEPMISWLGLKESFFQAFRYVSDSPIGLHLYLYIWRYLYTLVELQEQT